MQLRARRLVEPRGSAQVENVTPKAPKTQANALCRAVRPDNGVAFQKYNPRTNKWNWVFVGSAYYGGRTFTKRDVLFQLKPSRSCGGGEAYPSGWYRFVLVQWFRRKGGWRAQVLKASPAVYWSVRESKQAAVHLRK